MSLAQKMKLQDLKAKIEELNAPRRELLMKQMETAATKIQQDVLAYFTSKGFKISGQMPKVKATYNGGLETSIDFSNLKGDFIGSDGGVAFKYENKTFVLDYQLARGKAPERGSLWGSPEEIMQKEIKYYEEQLVPYLQTTGVSDLSGEVILYSRVKNATNGMTILKYHSVEEALDTFMD
ncbi:hypothetical protein D3H66_18875 [Citrobacter portucalensis]|uniref:Uncharacterized protein n=1 Tax=Citrobacter portucalensis TaxID=1639133 RepID=A0A5B0SWK6_9ENTR|nr:MULTISPECIES: hypothetical protein [Citrobacter]KAA1142241.1 hypothetical protein D3H66_18875 [Citrobacter portucalensis]QRQ74729.1 hypothetical protein JQN59_03200 [Citrobacter sp. B72]